MSPYIIPRCSRDNSGITKRISLGTSFYSISDLFYPPGKPISQHLLRYSELAVKYHSFVRKASHLPQSQLVYNSGCIRTVFVYITNIIDKQPGDCKC